MASLQLFVLALCSILLGVQGWTVTPEDLAGWVNVTDTTSAWTLSDGYAVINGGDISAYSLNLTGDLYAAYGSLGDLTAGNTTAVDLTAMNTTVDNLLVGELTAVNNSWVGGDVTVQGNLYADLSHLTDVEVMSLTVVEDTTVGGILFAQTNVQVTSDLNVGGNTRIFGDLLANSSLTVEESLTVNDQAHLQSLSIMNGLTTNELYADEATIDSLNVAENANITGNLWAAQDLEIGESASLGGSLSGTSAQVMNNYETEELMVDGWLYVDKKASFNGDLEVGGNLYAQTWATVGGNAQIGGYLNVGENLAVTGDITSEATLTGVDAMFETLTVDTGSIESLTAGFITSNNLVATDVTIANSFMSGMTTLDTLTVLGDSHLQDVMSTMVMAQSVMAGNATSGSLTVTGHSIIQDAEVKSSLLISTPSETDFYTSMYSGFADSAKAVDLMGQYGNIVDLSGDNLDYDNLNATYFRVSDQLNSTYAMIERSEIGNAWIHVLTGEHANITSIIAEETTTSTLNAGYGNVSMVESENIWTVNITSSESAWFDTLQSDWYGTETLMSDSATIEMLTSDMGWIDDLTSTTATLTNLWGTTADITDLQGQNLWFDRGHIQKLWNHNGITGTLDATQFIQTNWLWADLVNSTVLETVQISVTESAWFDDLHVRGNLAVTGRGTFESGFISGDTVLADLQVVDNTHLDTLSVTDMAFFTDLSVKRVTITDDFYAESANFGDTTMEVLHVTGDAYVAGTLDVAGDSALDGNLVVLGTTQFQTGSFTRIGTAIITTTDMEAFNMDVANGLFGSITVDDFVVNRVADFRRSITIDPTRNSASGGTYSWTQAIVPTALQADYEGDVFPVNALTVLHSGFLTVDPLVVASSSNASVAELRIHGDGTVDLIDGDVLADTFEITGDVVFENENNVAWVNGSAASTLSLAQGASAVFYTYDDLIDRDMGAPGAAWDPSRFHPPTDATDLLTLSAGHYKVAGNVYFHLDAPATTSAVSVATASIDAWWGMASNASAAPFWTVECVANFNVIAGETYGGSCAFADIIGVPKGQTVTLRTDATWAFSSTAVGTTLALGGRTQLQISELFERTSEEV